VEAGNVKMVDAGQIGAFATGSAEALGAAETATTTSLAATKGRPDRISRYFASR